jgi:hypothetical protein
MAKDMVPERPDTPDMHDPADTDIHSKKGAKPYPEPGKSKVATGPKNDTIDPAERNTAAPHDRGSERDGDWRSGADDMQRKVADEKAAWKKGLTQNR